MKFCKNLQRTVDISNTEWAPYWPNYKMLKKLLKEFPSIVPTTEGEKIKRHKITDSPNSSDNSGTDYPAHDSDKRFPLGGAEEVLEHSNDSDSSAGEQNKNAHRNSRKRSISLSGLDTMERNTIITTPTDRIKAMNRSPGEIAFFKLLHSECNKACRFFQNAEIEFSLREERIREGRCIMQKSNTIMVSDRWSLLAKSLYRLYKDLLLLETFAIMSYCSFSKILKKHDKLTGIGTREAFMTNVVNKANFTNYPNLLAMIDRTEALYEQVSAQVVEEGKDSLYEDERLFINMIHRLNKQTLEGKDAPVTARKRNKLP